MNKKTHRKKSTPSSKKYIIFLFVNCTAIEIFTGIVMWKQFALSEIIGCMPDWTPLVAIIGAVIGETVGYAVYCAKSTKENTKGGIKYLEAENESCMAG